MIFPAATTSFDQHDSTIHNYSAFATVVEFLHAPGGALWVCTGFSDKRHFLSPGSTLIRLNSPSYQFIIIYHHILPFLATTRSQSRVSHPSCQYSIQPTILYSIPKLTSPFALRLPVASQM
jgi:hypothetical protein